jgi:hypothetical protein
MRLGREKLIARLGSRMVELALSDRPQAFSAMCFLLRTIGGPQWRVVDPRSDEAPPGAGDAPRRARGR